MRLSREEVAGRQEAPETIRQLSSADASGQTRPQPCLDKLRRGLQRSLYVLGSYWGNRPGSRCKKIAQKPQNSAIFDHLNR
jgi:hypothetical protein